MSGLDQGAGLAGLIGAVAQTAREVGMIDAEIGAIKNRMHIREEGRAAAPTDHSQQFRDEKRLYDAQRRREDLLARFAHNIEGHDLPAEALNSLRDAGLLN